MTSDGRGLSAGETPLDLLSRIALRHRSDQKLLRCRQAISPTDPTHIEFENRSYINFASNDYLGLTHHPRMIAAVRQATEEYGIGAGAAGLITGYTNLHAAAERDIADWKQTQSSILLPSGYQANFAAIQTLAALADTTGRSTRFLIDKLAHASLIDAVRASDALFRIFPHNGLDKLHRLLRDAPAEQMQIVVTESIFSMDGDAADLQGLAELKKEFEFILLVDEAHASGVYGPAGSGYAAEMNLSDLPDISIVTLSKSIGCAGGAICASEHFIQAVVNFGRAWIYSTSVPAAVAAAASTAIAVMRDEPQRQQRLHHLARKFRAATGAIGLSDCPIAPIVLGDSQAATSASDRLKSAGFWVVPIRPPTVPPAGSRLRITLSCEHTESDIDWLIAALNKLK